LPSKSRRGSRAVDIAQRPTSLQELTVVSKPRERNVLPQTRKLKRCLRSAAAHHGNQSTDSASCHVPMTPKQAGALVETLRCWVQERDDLRALALVGSWARDSAKPSSDLDLVIVANDPEAYRFPSTWLCSIAFAETAFEVDRYEICAYGNVWSCHIYSKSEAEVELTFAAPVWAKIDPMDPGTRVVVADAFRAIVDKDGVLGRLVAAVCARSEGLID